MTHRADLRNVHDRYLAQVFFFNDTATTEIYTLSLHDALPISCANAAGAPVPEPVSTSNSRAYFMDAQGDRKSTRLNSSHSQISYAVFCLKKKRDIRSQQSGESQT